MVGNDCRKWTFCEPALIGKQKSKQVIMTHSYFRWKEGSEEKKFEDLKV